MKKFINFEQLQLRESAPTISIAIPAISSFIRPWGGYQPRGGGTLIFSHTRRLGPFLGVQNSEFQYFLGFSEKIIFFGDMKILWIFFGVITKLG